MSACGNSCSVVQLEGVYEDEEAVYMVQELCLGGDLRSVLQARAALGCACMLPALAVDALAGRAPLHAALLSNSFLCLFQTGLLCVL